MDHQEGIQKNAAEPYVMIWKDAYDILLGEQKANCKTEYLMKIFVYLKTKKKRYRAFTRTHACTFTSIYRSREKLEVHGTNW